jgi:hypothetical protein
MGIASFFGLGGEAVAAPVTAVGNVLDALFTSDEEELTLENAKLRLLQQPNLAQVELNKVEAQHRSVFVAGWRPAIGWVCALGLFMTFIINPILQWSTSKAGPTLPDDIMMELVIALLGLGALRTVEKMQGRTK